MGRYRFEDEIRRAFNVAYIGNAFNNFKNDISDIKVHPEVSMYYPDGVEPFVWLDHMSEENNTVLSEVSL